jgi:hypothetical protein
MTMRITKHQKIGGVSAIDARKLLRKYDERFREDWLKEALSAMHLHQNPLPIMFLDA